MILYLLIIIAFSQEADTKKEEKIFSYSKAPKSLFLIKKAKIESSVGEPTLSFSDLQKKNIASDERLVFQP